MKAKNILITGAGGYLGKEILKKLIQLKAGGLIHRIVATDIRPIQGLKEIDSSSFIFETLDVRDSWAGQLFLTHQIDTVIHLASIVTPGKKANRDFEYQVDVIGTQNILKACVDANVKSILISSSGASYGYHPENKTILTEERPLRGNFEFAYSYHKRLVEEELTRFREAHPDLQQTIFRIGTILGENVKNQITDLFEKPFQITVSGSESSFNFVWDQDVVSCFIKAVMDPKPGIYNLAGDGYLTVKERAQMMKKPVLSIPRFLLKRILFVLKKLGLTQYGPEQTMFIEYRPVLDNHRLKTIFGYIPTLTSRQVFECYLSKSFGSVKGSAGHPRHANLES